MKIKQFLSLCAALAALTFSSLAAESVLPLAVFDFEAKDEAVRDLGPKTAALLSAFLSAEPNVITVERAELEKVLGEQELGLSGTVSAETAAKVGHLTGAKVLVTGRAFMAGKEFVVVAKIIGTETSRVYGEVVRGASANALSDLSADLAKRIARLLREKGGTLVAKAVTREDRVERLKKAVRGSKLPVLLVKLPEQHFGAPASDPAAETEFSLLARQCGFTLVDGSGTARPEVELRGEAFSERGLRKGNLVSCKARVEIKAVDAQTGKVLVTDRQMGVAVDLSEQIAAKSAIQNAVADLAERVLPKLAR
jgi:hypothetical protein